MRRGDTATVDFVVTDPEGNPVKANLYLAVVDEAFFAVRNQVADPLRELYRDMGYPNLTRSTASTDGGAYNLFGGAEGGGEGDSIAIRSDFRDTAVVRGLDYGRQWPCAILLCSAGQFDDLAADQPGRIG